jgi:hypothetical protein
VDITQNISFLMNVFQKSRKIFEDELNYKLAQLQIADESFEKGF